MKKKVMILFFLILSQKILFAMSPSIGLISNYQLTSGPIYYKSDGSQKVQNMAVSSLDFRFDGTIYSKIGFGLGYAIGFQKDLFTELSSKKYNLIDLPPSLEMVLLIKYRQPINQYLDFEIGSGIVANIFSGSGEVDTKQIVIDYKEFGILGKVSVILKSNMNLGFLVGLESTVFTYHYVDSGTIVLPSTLRKRFSISPSIGILYDF